MCLIFGWIGGKSSLVIDDHAHVLTTLSNDKHVVPSHWL
jgi:hypothetical protein